MAKKVTGNKVTKEKTIKINDKWDSKTPMMFGCFTANELRSYLEDYHPNEGWELVEGVMNGKETYLQVFGSKSIVKCISALSAGMTIVHEKEQYNDSNIY